MPIALAKDLAALRQAAKGAIDAAAEASRLKYITEGIGQALVYQQKLAQAQAFLAKYPADPGTPPDAASYPLLQASLGIEAASLFAVAQVVNATATQWMALAAQIERMRLYTKAAVDAAGSEAAIASAVANATWP